MLVRRVVGAGGRLRAAAGRARRTAAGAVRAMKRPVRFWIGAAVVLDWPRLAAGAIRSTSTSSSPATSCSVRRARHRVEHPRRLRRLRELRHRRVLRPRRLHRGGAVQGARARRSRCRSSPRRRSARLLGFGVGLLTLRLRGIFFSIATVALIGHHGDAGHQLALRRRRHRRCSCCGPAPIAPFESYTQMLFVVMALLAVVAVAIARYIEISWIGRGLRAIRDNEEAAECSGRADAQAEALRLHRLRRADGRRRRADADVPELHRAGLDASA